MSDEASKIDVRVVFFFFKQKTAYEIGVRLVGSEMCIRDRTYTYADFVICSANLNDRRVDPFSTYPYLHHPAKIPSWFGDVRRDHSRQARPDSTKRAIKTSLDVNLSRKPGLDLCCDLLQHLQGVPRTYLQFLSFYIIYIRTTVMVRPWKWVLRSRIIDSWSS